MNYCQSCGMPMEDTSLYGSEKDGSKSVDYCKYCYDEGAFTADQTLDEMIATCIPFMVKEGMSETEASKLLHESLPHLKRWTNTSNRV